MKKTARLLGILLMLTVLIGLLSVTALADGDVAINSTNFPDATFREEYVRTYDTDGNGYLSASEIVAVTEIDCWEKGITSL